MNEKQVDVDTRVHAIADELARNQKSIAILHARAGAIRETERDIGDGFSKFESPFGTFPVGYQEAALAFPFILAAGYLVRASLLANLIRLRRKYHGLVRHGSDLAPEAVTRRMALVVPLSLDPALRSWHNGIATVLLLLPIPAFAVITAAG